MVHEGSGFREKVSEFRGEQIGVKVQGLARKENEMKTKMEKEMQVGVV